MNRYLVVATEDELRLPWAKTECNRIPIITGVGGTNVIRALRNLKRDSDILNVGYCGSYTYPIGTVTWPQQCRLWHPNVSFQEETFKLNSSSGVICLTAGDFVTDPEGLPPFSVVDMELAYILAFGFRVVSSVKYVSDNLNYKEYESSIESCKASKVFK